MQLDVQREASIAFERRGIHAERAGRGGNDPGGIGHRIREVQLDPKVCALGFMLSVSQHVSCC